MKVNSSLNLLQRASNRSLTLKIHHGEVVGGKDFADLSNSHFERFQEKPYLPTQSCTPFSPTLKLLLTLVP